VQKVQGVQGVQEVWFNRFDFANRSEGSGSASAVRPAYPVSAAKSHEELVVWQLSTELKRDIYNFVKNGAIARDPELIGQLRRAAASAPRNIAEGFGRFLPGPFIQSLRIANGELREVQELLRDACDRGYTNRDGILPLLRLSMRACKAIASLIRYLERSNTFSGSKGSKGAKGSKGSIG
jgi:four helix bundle protein